MSNYHTIIICWSISDELGDTGSPGGRRLEYLHAQRAETIVAHMRAEASRASYGGFIRGCDFGEPFGCLMSVDNVLVMSANHFQPDTELMPFLAGLAWTRPDDVRVLHRDEDQGEFRQIGLGEWKMRGER